jgi:hypothetical protein
MIWQIQDFPLNPFPGSKSGLFSESWGIRMRGGQLGLRRRIIRAIEASPSGLAVAEIAKREETGVRTIYSDLEALQLCAFPPYTEKVDWANHLTFIGILKPQILPGPPKRMENPIKEEFHPFIENLRGNNHPQCDSSTFQIMFGQKENPSIDFF